MTKTIKYTKAEQEEIMKLHLQEGRSLQSLSAEYNLGKGTLSYWLKKYRQEAENNPKIAEAQLEDAKILKLKKGKYQSLFNLDTIELLCNGALSESNTNQKETELQSK